MTDFLASIPAGLWFMVAAIVFVGVCGGLIFYALRSKGDVFAELTHGATSFKLQAKERPRAKTD
jgi:cytochrome c-type biogenesis protein CcmE